MSRKISSISKRMQEAMDIRGIKQADLCKSTGIGKSSISTYLSGEYEPKQTNLYKIAEALGVSIPWLTGYDVPMDELDPIKNVDNIIQLDKVNKLPIVGSIAAGKPKLAVEDIESYVMLDSSYKADFALRVSGDSMIDAGINDGDLALIKRDLCVENGEICAVSIDGHATLKRLYRNDDFLTLQPCNSKYQPIIVKENEEPYIVGKLTGIVRKY